MAKLADDIEEQIDQAIAEARDFYDDEVATSVRYVQAEDMFVLVLRSGRRVLIAREDLQELAKATPQQAADVRLEMLNSAVHWEQLDVDYPVKALADGLLGNDVWMKKLAEQKSPAYAA
jgi:hypothetical protein